MLVDRMADYEAVEKVDLMVLSLDVKMAEMMVFSMAEL